MQENPNALQEKRDTIPFKIETMRQRLHRDLSETKTDIHMKKIAVVILNWNGAEMLRRFLPSVIDGSAAEADIVVADNGSTDASCALIEREFPSVRLVRLAHNYGFAEGYNRALAQIDATYFMLLNSDVEVPAGWLRPLLDYMEAHPEAAACQPKLLSQRQPAFFEYAGAAGGYLDRYGYPFCRGRVFGDVERDTGQYDTVAPLLWATGAALLIRRTDWLSAGGLDRRFFAHMEEIDLCWRLRSRGRAIVCVPSACAYHVGGASLEQGHPQKTFLNFRNNLFMLYKNLPADRLRSVMRTRRVLDYIAALRFLLSGDAPNARAVVRARREFRRRRAEFRPQREENLRRATQSAIPECRNFSLLIQYYIKGKKKFSDLPGIS